jgi:hypothetical protein
MCTFGIASILILRSCFPSLRDRHSP